MNEAFATGGRDPLLGRTLAGRYRLLSELGTGGMSSVYLAQHVLIERLCAIKVLRSELTGEPDYRARFLREARAVNRIHHPSIVEISDFGEATLTLGGGRRAAIVYLVMEYVAGETLHTAMMRAPMRCDELLPLLRQLTSALSRAHQAGVIHRDIKPENILIARSADGAALAKLTDFGVARVAATAEQTTLADQVFGTPGYIAPEYLLGETSIDGRADLYSLGVVIYEALSGWLPYEGGTATDLLMRPIIEAPVAVPPS